MTHIRVKICGINSPDALDAAIAAGADWLGFVFFPPSPRYVTPGQAAALSARASEGPPRVGLFVNPTEEDIAAALSAVPLSALQVYGPVDVPALRRRFDLPVWRPVAISTRADLPQQDLGADMLLLEAKPPSAATRPGGNATRFDWTLLRDWTPTGPWMLAGGLNPANVAEAVRVTGARAVDVSSGVESEAGRKDPDRIRAFIARTREIC